MKILTGSQHRELDLLTIEEEGIESIELMERAARAMAFEIMSRWDQQRTIYVFAGPGNNGGDGLSIGRLMAQQGYRVVIYLFNVKASLCPNCEANRELIQVLLEKDRPVAQTGKSLSELLTFREITQGFDFPTIRKHDVIVDALFGTGLSKPLQGGFAGVVRKINSLKASVVSIDIPSGLMCERNDTTDRNIVIHATLTLTVQLPKLAFLMPENEQCVGEWTAVDINLSVDGIEEMITPYSIMELDEIKEMRRRRPTFAHKGTMGHALLVAGSYGMAGAAQLAAKACLRSGIGKLTLHTPAANNTIMQISVPEAVLIADRDKTVISDTIETRRFNAVGIGPGLGMDDLTAEALQRYIMSAEAPLVLDADALNLISLHRELLPHLPSGTILTPHVGELENLVGHCNSSTERLDRAQELAEKHRVYVILKGHYSAICTPHGRVIFCPRGNAGMATPGSGDVLTGIITGLLAQGYDPLQACMMGTWLHATAGDHAAAELTEDCMLASDIIRHLPDAIRELAK